MIVSYRRTGGQKPPRDREQLDIEKDGSFTMWRTVASATNPPTPVGRFSGQLDSPKLKSLESAVATAAQSGDLKITPVPGAANETITIDQIKASMGSNAKPEGAWARLTTDLRGLLVDLASFPQAAIAVEVASDGRTARLVHRGRDPLRLDLSSLTVRAVLWKNYQKLGDWNASPTGSLGEVTANPGWALDLPFDHHFQVVEGSVVRAYINFEMFDGALKIPVSLTSA